MSHASLLKVLQAPNLLSDQGLKSNVSEVTTYTPQPTPVVSTAMAELKPQHRQEIEDAFRLFDPESSGYINTKDLKVVMRALGFEPRKEEIRKILQEELQNSSETGKISEHDFIQLMSGRFSNKDANEEILRAFRLFDDDETGNITFANLKRVARELGETISDEELKEMIAEADSTGGGAVSEHDFVRIMKKTCLY